MQPGHLLCKWGIGVAINEDEAFKWVKRAADAGLTDAQYTFGAFFMNGIGVDVDVKKAKEL